MVFCRFDRVCVCARVYKPLANTTTSKPTNAKTAFEFFFLQKKYSTKKKTNEKEISTDKQADRKMYARSRVEYSLRFAAFFTIMCVIL